MMPHKPDPVHDFEKVHPPNCWHFIALLIGCTLLTVIYGIAAHGLISVPEHRGLFGDSFGALTALFSAFAFAGVAFTILLQSHQLALQRKEFRLALEEFRMARETMAKQLESMEQSFRLSQQVADANFEPQFTLSHVSPVGSATTSLEITLQNEGAPVSDLHVELADDYPFRLKKTEHSFLASKTGKLYVQLEGFDRDQYSGVALRISFRNRLNQWRFHEILIPKKGSKIIVREKGFTA